MASLSSLQSLLLISKMADKKSAEYRVIPASQRPDGTWRKEIKVKAGYIPPDEMDRYQSRGRQFAGNRSGLPPGMAADEATAVKKTKNQKKNERRKLKKQEAKDNEAETPEQTGALAPGIKNLKVQEDKPSESQASREAIEKKLKTLRKKLRQIEELEKKVNNKEVKELTKEQNDKVSRKKGILDEIEDLELDLKLCDD